MRLPPLAASLPLLPSVPVAVAAGARKRLEYNRRMSMRILLAKPRGFCAGVVMAIDSLDRALELFGPPIYVYHEIVHNSHVVERFRSRGVTFVDSIDEVPAGATVLYSAHGVSPEIRLASERRGLRAIDATCPLVTKVHVEARRFARDGYTIILIGHEGHDEVIGTMGEAPDRMRLVESPDDVERLEVPDEHRVAYLTQTTLSVDDANRVIDALRRRFPHIAAPPREDICYATQNRQEAVRTLGCQADLVLVVGSQNSSNSIRLTEVAGEQGVSARRIDGPADLDATWFDGVGTVLVTAGASAPETLVAACVDWIRQRYDATVQEVAIRDEDVYFPLPKQLRVLSSP
jgi:4-hydroxy-3-methylbut-2-enyl diphosphate reductase